MSPCAALNAAMLVLDALDSFYLDEKEIGLRERRIPREEVEPHLHQRNGNNDLKYGLHTKKNRNIVNVEPHLLQSNEAELI